MQGVKIEVTKKAAGINVGRMLAGKIFMAVLALTLCACREKEPESGPEYCALHDERCRTEHRESTAGLTISWEPYFEDALRTGDYAAARAEIFPNAVEEPGQGIAGGDEAGAVRLRHYCQSCREARDEWLEKKKAAYHDRQPSGER